MPQSLAQLYVHLIFSTKNRTPYLVNPDVRSDLFAYVAGIQKNLSCTPICNGGVSDHVHLLFGLSKTLALSEAVKELKRVSSMWIKQQPGMDPQFHWQDGYGAFSVSPSQLEQVIRYIEGQEDHHRTVTFQEELRTFFEKYEVQYDERYVWD